MSFLYVSLHIVFDQLTLNEIYLQEETVPISHFNLHWAPVVVQGYCCDKQCSAQLYMVCIIIYKTDGLNQAI